jgi:hypothetical protein
MKKLQFNVKINAPVSKVYDVMLGISNKTTYEQWTALFNPTSSYEGSWSKGSKILFIGTDEKGEKGGMVSEIADNIPNRFVSNRAHARSELHRGILMPAGFQSCSVACCKRQLPRPPKRPLLIAK